MTGKEKRVLRGMGQKLKASVIIGKAGLNPSVIEHINLQLANNELVKIRIAESYGSRRKVIASEIAAATNSICVGITGKTLLLYRPDHNGEAPV